MKVNIGVEFEPVGKTQKRVYVISIYSNANYKGSWKLSCKVQSD